MVVDSADEVEAGAGAEEASCDCGAGVVVDSADEGVDAGSG